MYPGPIKGVWNLTPSPAELHSLHSEKADRKIVVFFKLHLVEINYTNIFIKE